jgi:two-component system, chemotaxis family, protein-glutamate methylesterase/glutaminase
MTTPIELVAIGASWGGLTAIKRLLEPLPVGFGAAIAIAQHRRAGADGRLAELIGAHCALDVAEAEDKQALDPGIVLLAPPDYHMLIEPGTVALSVDEPVHYSRPSIDVLLQSAADAYGDRVAAVVLTGANADGARGLARIAARGGMAIVQDPDTAARREMPEAALAATPTAHVLALDQIGMLLADLVGTRERARR